MDGLMFQGFRVFELKSSHEGNYNHQILVKKHSVRNSDSSKPSDQTLFLANLPPYVTKENLVHIFQKFGKVADVFLQYEANLKVTSDPFLTFTFLESQKNVHTFKYGYVVFVSPKTLNEILLMPASTVLEMHSSVEYTGLDRWYKEYNDSFMSVDTIKVTCKKIILDYDEKKKKEKEALSKNQEDDDGWITVSSSNKRKRSQTELGNKNKKRRRKKTTILNFYEFQNKTAKLEHLTEHRKKYEEDRKRLAMLKSARKFKPL